MDDKIFEFFDYVNAFSCLLLFLNETIIDLPRHIYNNSWLRTNIAIVLKEIQVLASDKVK